MGGERERWGRGGSTPQDGGNEIYTARGGWYSIVWLYPCIDLRFPSLSEYTLGGVVSRHTKLWSLEQATPTLSGLELYHVFFSAYAGGASGYAGAVRAEGRVGRGASR